MNFTITVRGRYPYRILDSLREALVESIRAHCIAYGCAVHVEFETRPESEAS
jgi:hypothetical protein